MKIREDLKEVLDGPNAEGKSHIGLRYFFVTPDRCSALRLIGAAILIGIVGIFVYPAYIILEILGFESENPLLYLLGIIGFFVGLYLVGILGYYFYISD